MLYFLHIFDAMFWSKTVKMFNFLHTDLKARMSFVLAECPQPSPDETDFHSPPALPKAIISQIEVGFDAWGCKGVPLTPQSQNHQNLLQLVFKCFDYSFTLLFYPLNINSEHKICFYCGCLGIFFITSF